MTTKTNECRCPVRPYYSLGSMASGSATETANVRRWESEHGDHPYAKARDELAKALQYAEGTPGLGEKRGEAVLDMVHDAFALMRRSKEIK